MNTIMKMVNGVSLPLSNEELLEFNQRESELQLNAFANAKAKALVKINTDDNAIYEKAVGNKLSEYQQAEIDALAFKVGGYIADPIPKSIKSWQDARWRLNWTAQDAADDIILQATKWRMASDVIREKRLKAKEDGKAALTIEELNTVMAQWNGFVAYIYSQI